MSIQNKIEAWQKSGLISAKQASALLAYENKNSKPYLLYLLIALGVFFVGAGIISVIAANWDAILPFYKLLADFVLLIVAALFTWYAANNNKTMLFEGGLLLFAFLVLASIGLIAQIYQLQSYDLSAFLLWSFLVFPLLFFTQKAFLPWLVMPVMWFSAFDVVLTSDVCENAENLWPFSPYLIWILMWFVIFQILQSIPKLKSKSLLSVLSVMLAIFAAWLFSSVDLGYAFSWQEFSVLDYKNSTVIGLALFALLLVGAAFYVDCKTSNNKFIPLIMTLLLIGTLWKVYFFVTFAALLISGYYAYRYQKNKCLNLIIFLAAIRILSLFTDIFGSLLTSGLGLIGLGILIVALAVVSLKFGSALNGRMKNAH